MIYSIDTVHSNDMVQAVIETWGHKCDGFMVGSNTTNPTTGSVDIPHLGPEQYGSMWQKVRSMWAYVHDNYLDEYDFFYVAGEDTYVVVENLREIIQQAHAGTLYKDPNWIPTKNREVEKWEEKFTKDGGERPLYLGAIYVLGPHRYMCAGGAGYVLNRAAIRQLIKQFPMTNPDTISSKEDQYVAVALREQGIACSDTRDASGAWRFHHLDAEFQYQYTKDFQAAVWGPLFLKRTRGIMSRLGLDGISEASVSFHLTKSKDQIAAPERLRRYHAIIYGYCQNKDSSVQ